MPVSVFTLTPSVEVSTPVKHTEEGPLTLFILVDPALSSGQQLALQTGCSVE